MSLVGLCMADMTLAGLPFLLFPISCSKLLEYIFKASHQTLFYYLDTDSFLSKNTKIQQL